MTDPVVERYLHRLHSAAAVLPPDQQAELVDGITAHIAEAYDSGAVADEAGLRTLLDRLGEPEDIVASALQDSFADGGDGGAPPRAAWPTYGPNGAAYDSADLAQPVLRPTGTGRETAAVLFMTVGSIIPFAGWLVGVVLLWTSTRWRTWEKTVATLVFPGGPFLVLIAGLVGLGGGTQTCTSTGGIASDGTETSSGEICTSNGYISHGSVLLVLLAIVWFVLPIVIGIMLLGRARRRAALEPWTVVPLATTSPWSAIEVAAVALVGVGSFLAPFVGPSAGLIFVWMSRAWTRSEKITATVLTSVPLVIGLVFIIYIALSFGH